MSKYFYSLFAITSLLFIGRSVFAADQPVSYTAQTLPFDANTATGRGGLLSGLTSITTIGLGKDDPVSVTYSIVNIFLSLLGLGFLLLLIYGGTTWILARGNEEQITKSKTILFRALVGLVIILAAQGLAFGVAWFVYRETTGGSWLWRY